MSRSGILILAILILVISGLKSRSHSIGRYQPIVILRYLIHSTLPTRVNAVHLIQLYIRLGSSQMLFDDAVRATPRQEANAVAVNNTALLTNRPCI